MGIYIFNKETLVDVLNKTTYQDFGKEVFPAAFRTRHVGVHLFDGSWDDIGTIRSFFEANLSLADRQPPFQLMEAESPIYSRARFLPPSTFEGATISRSIIADGCRIGRGAVIENSIVGLRSIIGENAVVRNSVLMGADEYETAADLKGDAKEGMPPIGIGAGSVIDGAIVDKNCRIGEKVFVVNESGAEESPNGDDCVIREGIPVVVKDATLPNGWNLS